MVLRSCGTAETNTPKSAARLTFGIPSVSPPSRPPQAHLLMRPETRSSKSPASASFCLIAGRQPKKSSSPRCTHPRNSHKYRAFHRGLAHDRSLVHRFRDAASRARGFRFGPGREPIQMPDGRRAIGGQQCACLCSAVNIVRYNAARFIAY